MVALIIRPFGTKQGIDFDRVESQLIEPVLASLDIRARTTSEIAARGNLRLDMFERLLAADLVIADISTHNAGVYYELGVRHALRDRMTVLIRAEANDVPFDLRMDRCVAYDAADPGAAVDALRRTIEASMRSAGPDSPVFMLLPGPRPTDLDDLRPVPGGFREEVEAAADAGDRPKLAVLADEAGESEWRLGGLRLVASAQIDLQAWPDVRSTLDAVRRLRPDDVDANLGLGFVMQRLGDLPAARAALERVLGALELAPQPPTAPSPARVRTLVFSGHRIDDPGRANPRFPPDAEAKAIRMIRAAIEEEQRRAGEAPVSGIAGGASGGDIIFHEQCAALGIPTELLLALPRDEFSAASVVAAGTEWLDRFLALWQRLDVKILSETGALPDWLAGRDDYSIWQRNNRWILHSATSRADADVTLIVLWDGRGGDGPGGTEDMVELARSRDVRIVHLDAAELLADQPS